MQAAAGDIWTQLRRLAASEATVEALMTQALPQVVAELHPHAGALRLYRASGGYFLPIDGAPALPQNDLPLHYRATAERQWQYDPAQRLLVAPLIDDDSVNYLLEITVNAASAAPELPAALTQPLQRLLVPLEWAISTVTLRQALMQLTHAAAEISAARTYPEVAAVFSRVVLERGQFISINVIDFGADDQIRGFTVVATANNHQTFTTHDYYPLNATSRALYAQLAEAHQPLFIADVATSPELDAANRERLLALKITSLYLVPLMSGGRLIGFVALNATRGTLHLAPAQTTTLQSLARLVAISVENRELLQRTQTTLAETQTIYEVTRSLMQATDVPDILHTIWAHIGQDAANVVMLEMQYASQELTEVHVTYAVRGQQVVEVQVPLHPQFSPAELQQVQRYWEQVGQQIEYVEDLAEAVDYPAALRQFLLAQQVGSAIIIPIFEAGQRERHIGVLWQAPRAFSEAVRRQVEALQVQMRLVLQNQQYVTQLQARAQTSAQQVHLLGLLNAMVNFANVEQDANALLHQGARLLTEAAGSDHCGIALLEPNRAASVIVASYPENAAFKGSRIEITDDSVAHLLRMNRAPLIIEDVAHDTQLSATTRTLLQGAQTYAALFLPMYSLEQELMGTVGIDWHQPTTIPPDIVEAAQTLVNQLAISLQKLRLLENSRRQAEQMQHMAIFSQTIQASLETQQILETTLVEAQSIVAFDYMAILLDQDGADDYLRLVAAAGARGSQVQLPGVPYPLAQDTLAQRTQASSTLTYIEETGQDWETDHPERSRLRALVCVPVLVGEVALGLLQIGSATPFAYTPADLAAIQQMTTLVGVALTNAAAFTRSEKTARNRSLANHITARLQEQIDVSSILSLTAEELGRALGARRARIRLGAQTDKRENSS